MAMTGVLRPGFIQIRVLDMGKALTHYVDRIGLELVGTEADGRVYLKGFDEFDRHSVILREADAPGFEVMAFKVASDADLDTFHKRLQGMDLEVDRVPAGEQPGLGRRIGFTLPSGHRIELYAECARAAKHPPVINPDVWHSMPNGMKATRFDHALLYGPDVARVKEIFEQALDFRTAEYVETPDAKGYLGVWLSCGTKAHDIAFVECPEKNKFHHVSFMLDTWQDVATAADIISVYDIPLDIGPTRHGITRGQTIYFFDPSGNRNEVFAGGYTYYPDNPTRYWEADQLGKGIFYYDRRLNEAFLSVYT
jgi:catechol 2,3-dioxygenase